MISKEKLEGYMLKLNLNYEEASPGTWIIKDLSKGLENVVVAATDPIVVIRVKVMNLPAGNKEKLYEKLLKLNANDMLHGAYGIDGENIIMIDTLEAETMDLEEFQAAIDAIGFALSQHYTVLQEFRK
ncbi:MAG TPA: hypothetical protein ENN69_03125 [Spirochaetia bacterium]|nr:hypothetical protein [Spirochaetia bacterium]